MNMKPKRHHHHARGRRGYAMLVVMILILTTTAMAAVHSRHLNSALRIEQARQRSEDRSRGPVMVLAIACARLESGDPPSNDISYQYLHTDGTQSLLYRITYQNVGTDRWSITADPDSTATSLPDLPSKF